MTKIDREYVDSILSEIEEGLEEVRSITSLSLENFIKDRSRRFSMRYSVVLIVEAAADLGLMILRAYFNDEARSYREVFLKLAERGVIGFNTASGMASLASLRNMIVHRYWSIDDVRIYREAKGSGLRVVEDFIKEVKGYVSKDP